MKNRKDFYKIYWKLQSLIVPQLKYSQLLYEDTLNSIVNSHKIWLDIGCGHNILTDFRSHAEKELTEKCKILVGLDYDLNSLTKNKVIFNKIKGDIKTLPFKNNTFDLLSANMVVEHFDNPKRQFQEIYRVLKPGGIFLFHTPNVLGYTTILAKIIPKSLKKLIINIIEGRKEEDIFTTYYKANSIKKIKYLAENSGFKIFKLKMLVTNGQFTIFPPFLIFELFWIKILMTKAFKIFRTNIIAILIK